MFGFIFRFGILNLFILVLSRLVSAVLKAWYMKWGGGVFWTLVSRSSMHMQMNSLVSCYDLFGSQLNQASNVKPFPVVVQVRGKLMGTTQSQWTVESRRLLMCQGAQELF